MHFLMLARPVAFLKKMNIIIPDRPHLVRRVFAGLFPALNQVMNVHHNTGADLPNDAFRIKNFPRLDQKQIDQRIDLKIVKGAPGAFRPTPHIGERPQNRTAPRQTRDKSVAQFAGKCLRTRSKPADMDRYPVL